MSQHAGPSRSALFDGFRLLSIIAALSGALILLATSFAERASAQSVSHEQAFIAAVNEVRAERGLPALLVESQLTTAARSWTQQQANLSCPDPAPPGGSIYICHAPDISAGVTHRFAKIGENVGTGEQIGLIMDAFVASPSHLRNIVDPDFTYIGVGVVSEGGRLTTTHRFMSLQAGATLVGTDAPTTQAPTTTAAPTTTIAPTTTTTTTASLTTTTAPTTTTPATAPVAADDADESVDPVFAAAFETTSSPTPATGDPSPSSTAVARAPENKTSIAPRQPAEPTNTTASTNQLATDPRRNLRLHADAVSQDAAQDGQGLNEPVVRLADLIHADGSDQDRSEQDASTTVDVDALTSSVNIGRERAHALLSALEAFL